MVRGAHPALDSRGRLSYITYVPKRNMGIRNYNSRKAIRRAIAQAKACGYI
jgi:hypothetical protein